MTSSSHSLSALFPDAAFSITQGETVIGGLHGSTRHFFCGHCMSWLFTRPEGLDEFVNIRPAMLDEVESFAPFIETFVSEKLHFAETGAPRRFERFPEPNEFASLVQAYASWHATSR